MLISELYIWHDCFKFYCKLPSGKVVWFSKVKRRALWHVDVPGSSEFGPYTRVKWEYNDKF